MIDYELAINLIDIISSTIIWIMISIAWYYIMYFFLSFKKVPIAPHSDKYTKFAVLVPARNESKVISHIIKALKNQTYPKEYFDVWFIIESEDDPTAKIAKKAGFNYFVRDQLNEYRRTKGFALQECINYFNRNNIIYDAYMIFDADNVMEPAFIEKMNDLRQTGVQVGSAYRNFTNASTNWLTCTSATFFTYMNTFTSRGRTILFKKALLSGTGYYVDKKIIDDAGGWIFTGMTEDTQLTGYCFYHNVRMRYYPIAQFYDEQCETWKASHNQMIRWIWGFFYNKKLVKSNRENVYYHATTPRRYKTALFEYRMGLVPFAVCAVVSFLTLVTSVILAIFSIFQAPDHSWSLFMHVLGQFLIIYLFYFALGLFTCIHDKKQLKFNWATTLWAASTYAFFFFGLLYAAVDGLIFPSKRRTWKPIPHEGRINNSEAKKASK